MKILFLPHASKKESGDVFKTGDILPFHLRKYSELKILYKNEETKILKACKNFKPDFIISLGLVGFYPILFNKFRMINIPHMHIWMDDYSKFEKNIFIKKIKAKIEKMIVINSDIVFSISKFRQKKAKKWGRSILYLPQGVFKREIDASKKKKLNGRFNVVYVGMISKQKRVDKILEIANKLNESINVYLIGTINKKEISSNIPKNIFLLGQMSKKDTLPYLKSADVLILTMDNDSCLKMQDYIYLQKPIVALSGQVENALVHNKTAFITNDISIGINYVLKNKKYMEKISKNLKDVKTYSWDEVAKKYIKEMKTYEKKKKRNNKK